MSQVEKIAMTFARRAKPINVRKLKGAIWTLLNDDDKVGKETEPTTESEDTRQPVPDEAPASDKAVERVWSNIVLELTCRVYLHFSHAQLRLVTLFYF